MESFAPSVWMVGLASVTARTPNIISANIVNFTALFMLKRGSLLPISHLAFTQELFLWIFLEPWISRGVTSLRATILTIDLLEWSVYLLLGTVSHFRLHWLFSAHSKGFREWGFQVIVLEISICTMRWRIVETWRLRWTVSRKIRSVRFRGPGGVRFAQNEVYNVILRQQLQLL